MKKVLLSVLIPVFVLALVVSCDGSASDKVFKNHKHNYKVNLDGSWVCTVIDCNQVLTGTDAPYITVLGNDPILNIEQPTKIISLKNLTKAVSVGTGSIDNNATNDGFVYENTSEAQKVVIKTNGGTLTVNGKIGTGKADSDEIYHYGKLDKVEVNVASYCFYTHAFVQVMDLKKGKAVADKNGYVGLITAAADTSIKEQNGGIFVIPSGTDETGVEDSIYQNLGYKEEGGKLVLDSSSEKGQERAELLEKVCYEISTKEELIAFRNYYNSGNTDNRKIVLTDDIDMTGVDWIPIGTWEYPFQGTFDGQNHTINGLTLGETSGIYSTGRTTGEGEVFGFFGIVGDVDGDTDDDVDVSISNVTFTNVNIVNENAQNVGTIIGYAPTSANFSDEGKGYEYAGEKWKDNTHIGKTNIVIKNVSVSGKISVKAHVGGFIGKLYAESSATITDCTNNLSIKTYSTGNLAGFVALCSGNLTLDNCSNTDKASLNYIGLESLHIGEMYAGSLVPVSSVEVKPNCNSKIKINIGKQVQGLYLFFVNPFTVSGYNLLYLTNCGTDTVVVENCIVKEKVRNYGTMTINSCNSGVTSVEDLATVYNYSSGQLTIISGSFKSFYNGKSEKAGNKLNNATAILNGGHFYGDSFYNYKKCNVTVNNGVTVDGKAAIYGTTTFYGGTISNVKVYSESGSTVTFNDGTYSSVSIMKESAGNVILNGGTYTSNIVIKKGCEGGVTVADSLKDKVTDYRVH